jgi:hypothetical protein
MWRDRLPEGGRGSARVVSSGRAAGVRPQPSRKVAAEKPTCSASIGCITAIMGLRGEALALSEDTRRQAATILSGFLDRHP